MNPYTHYSQEDAERDAEAFASVWALDADSEVAGRHVSLEGAQLYRTAVAYALETPYAEAHSQRERAA